MNRLLKTTALTLALGITTISTLSAQPVADSEGDLGVGTIAPTPSALLDLTSTTKGFLMPRMSTAERNAILSPAIGLMIFNTDDGIPQIWSDASGSSKWDTVLTTGSNAGWLTKGNTGLTDGTDNYFGTLDNIPVRILTNNAERMRIEADGDFGIGTTTPAARLDVAQTGAVEAAGRFSITNAASTGDAVRASQSGLGRGLYATINNTSNIVAAVRGETNGGGYGVFGQATGNGNAGFFQISNPASTSSVMNVTTNGIGSGVTVQLTNASNGARGLDVLQTGVGPGVFATSAGGNAVWGITSSISAAGVIGDNTFGEAVVGRNRGGIGVGAVVGRNDSSGYGVRGFNTKDGIGVIGQAGISGGTGVGGRFENVNAANTSSTVQVATNGIGSGVTVQLTNASNGARGIDVLQSGVGPGVFATSAGGNAVWGITSSISAAGVIGDNTFGEAVVGRNRGGNGVGAVVGRNDSSGYGVRGFNTKDGIGVLGQAGISGGTGVGGRFENVNAANGNDALQAATNGTGWAGSFTNANNSSASKGVRVSTTANQGGNALTIANGTLSLSRQNPYASNTVIDDNILVVTTAGNVTIPTGAPLVDGATVWVVNNAGAGITITNTTVGGFNVNAGRAVQLLFVSTVSGANWIPVQP